MKKHKSGKRPVRPEFALPDFLTFARTPHVTAFEIPAAGRTGSITFIAVNAHLIYGKMKERRAEFRALVDWMSFRLKAESKMAAPNFILLGDLNMDLEDPVKDRRRAERYIGDLKHEVFGARHSARIYFPFICNHPRTGELVRTNARHSQTFDQIGFFLGKDERKLPLAGAGIRAGKDGADGFDYGVFDFAELFSQSFLGRPISL